MELQTYLLCSVSTDGKVPTPAIESGLCPYSSLQVLFWHPKDDLAFPIHGVSIPLNSPVLAQSSGAGHGGSVATGRVHGGTALTLTSGGVKPTMQTSGVVVGTEGGAVVYIPPCGSHEVMGEVSGWEVDARRVLGFVHQSHQRSVQLHVEGWVRDYGKRVVSGEAVFASKPSAAQLYDGSHVVRTKPCVRIEPHALRRFSPILGSLPTWA